MFRLEDGAYRQAEPEPKANDTDPEEHWSNVFGAYIRMMPDPREAFSEEPEDRRPPPRFQWWDPERNRWRDRETDAEVEQDRILQERDQTAQERDQAIQERTNIAVDLLRAHLGLELATTHLNQIEAVWHRDGPPTDVVDRILKVRETPDAWQSLLLPDEPDDD